MAEIRIWQPSQRMLNAKRTDCGRSRDDADRAPALPGAGPLDRPIAETGSGEETLQQLRNGQWDLVILDINMPDRSGIDILRHIRAATPIPAFS